MQEWEAVAAHDPLWSNTKLKSAPQSRHSAFEPCECRRYVVKLECATSSIRATPPLSAGRFQRCSGMRRDAPRHNELIAGEPTDETQLIPLNHSLVSGIQSDFENS
jgi:hypothetical protein